MTLRKIAKSGMKGRRKDSWLLKLVVSLSFAFITAALVFQASMEQTDINQKKELYGSWQAAYLGGNENTLNRLKGEKEVKDIAYSTSLGTASKLGSVGTLSQELKEVGNFTLYKGEFPKADNEIAVELNQLSNAGMELEVGQKLLVDFVTTIVDINIDQQAYELELQAMKEGYTLNRYGYHDNPNKRIGDINVIVSTDYVYYFKPGEPSDEQTIKTKGFMTHREVVMQKEFVITGILNTYSDKWDLGGHAVPNAFVTVEAGKKLSDAFYNNSYVDVSSYKPSMNIFLNLHNLNTAVIDKLEESYPDMKPEENEQEYINSIWRQLAGRLSSSEFEKVNDFYNAGNAESSAREVSAEDSGLLKSELSKAEGSTSSFRRNSFTYPDTSNSVAHIITYAILGIIFVTTVCAVFQIFLTQIKRRGRKLVLLKSIGATKLQLTGILAWEALFLWFTGLIYGGLSGTGLSVLILTIMRLTGNGSIAIAIPGKLLLIGIAVGTVSLFAGVLFPAVSAVNIPLTGTMAEKQKHSGKVWKAKGSKNAKPVKQNFLHITLRYLKNNRGKNLLSFAISLFIISILSATLYLSYNAWQRYNNSVIETGRPDYTLKAIYGENQNKLPEIEQELKSIKGVKAVESYKYGKNLLFWYEGIEKDPLLTAFEELLPDKLKQEHFSRYVNGRSGQPEYISSAYYSYYYGIDTKAEYAQSIFHAVQEGTIDMEKFKSGEEVILLLPLVKEGEVQVTEDTGADSGMAGYNRIKAAVGVDKRFQWVLEENNAYYISTDRKYKQLYDKAASLKAGDKIYLSTDKEIIDEAGRVTGFRTTEVTIGGIIYYFPEKGIWPFSNLNGSYTVIGSMDGMETLYPNSKMGLFRIGIEQMTEMVKVLYPSSYGRTLWNITASDKDNQEVLDAALLTFANKYGFTLYNYKESSERMLAEALNNILIIALLGGITSVIALIAFYNTAVSKMEQEKNRIGILQALGVTRHQFTCQYLLQGLVQGVTAAALANAGVLLVLLLVTVGTLKLSIGSFSVLMEALMADKLWLFPWLIHLCINLVFVAVTAILQAIPAIRIARQYPVENIRSLGR
ncbi:ABC transporter permease [Clostridium sp. KNHs205]|uniref:ABC transporter permease n=1 Tax=Clostridium sp. KNHs205 TaxID=1449050 RepID=UPI00051BDAED|nr:ABC transporter permease [Clostridium sp. KNHs205]